MPPVRRHSLADQVAEALLERIRSGEWALGAKLPAETTLGPQLGVGRSTVREAIRQLAGLGVLQTRQGAGVFVVSLDVDEDWDLVLRRVDITTVLEARISIESEAAALAAERRTPSDIRRMRSALEHRAGARSTIEELVDADLAFHRSILSASHNEILVGLFDDFTPRQRQAMVEMLRIHHEFGSDEDHGAHAQVLEAIVARDPERARALSRDDLKSLKLSLS
ncbi:FadR family transcriptional regulator [Nocardioides carbamazepini]|uniref:FadR/GntR family transcriptional regulator n=1 Tax=Nocardioides carbamazepini TaxID=2854259 RepID=UPI002149A0D3|nr:FadR/GntR family transcriptional regulator [Nocardioides carbamazepini]MCR1785274.1 FadR family transcriptional regulator [Nocardioides carbamazepini]